MLKMGLVGLGSMGRGHLSVLEQLMADGVDIKLVALCDIDPKAFGKVDATLNLEGMEKAKEAVKVLTKAGGFIRHEMMMRLELRKVPEFHFIADDSIEYSAGIQKILREIGEE